MEEDVAQNDQEEDDEEKKKKNYQDMLQKVEGYG